MLLRETVYNALRREILECRLFPGSELREQTLAERFEVSKSPVREALMRLQRDQLIEVTSRQGYRVTPISLSDARDMYSFRAVLEVACAAEATQRANDTQLQSLSRFRVIPRNGGFFKYNRDFHCALFEASQNERMAGVACELIEQMDRLTRISVGSMHSRDPSQLLKEHCEIIDAMQARDGRHAAKLLKKHISDASRRVLKALEQIAVRS